MVKKFMTAFGVWVALGIAFAGIPLADFPGDLSGEIALVNGPSAEMRIPGRYLPRAGDAFMVVREDVQKQIHVLARGILTLVEGYLVRGEFTAKTGFEVRSGDRVVVRTNLSPLVISQYGFSSKPLDFTAEDSNTTTKPAGMDPSLIAVSADRLRSEAAQKSERLYREALPLDASRGEPLLRQAAGLNHAAAALELSQRLFKSTAVEEAKLWLQRAAELGSVEAQFLLGDSWAGSGLPGFERNLHKALLWYEKAGEVDPRRSDLRKQALGTVNSD